VAWTDLAIAAVLEVGWTVALKYSAGFTRLVPSILTIVAMVASLFFLAQALRSIPVWKGLRGVDRDRSGWHRRAGHHIVFRGDELGSTAVNRAHRRWHYRS